MYGMGDVKKKIMVLNKAIGTQTWMSHTIHFYHLFNFVKENANKLKKKCKTLYRFDYLDVAFLFPSISASKCCCVVDVLDCLHLIVMRQFNIGKATANSIGNRFQRRLHQSDPDLFFFSNNKLKFY